jgi:4-azaleucine resistance transporter AzlC
VPPTADGSARADAGAGPAPDVAIAVARRRLLLDSLAIGITAAGFGLVYGLSARDAGLSPLEAIAMSTIVFAGAAQFAALGYLAAGLPWPAIALLTLFINARHLLYSAALAPRLRQRPAAERAVAAHLLTDEAFALGSAHFARLGRADMPGYWVGAIVATFIPWNLATIAGSLLGGAIPDPTRFGLDVVFPAAMLGLAAGLVTGRRELVAAGAGAAIAVTASLVVGTGPGIIAGGLVGPLLAMAVPDARPSAPARARGVP